MSQVSEFVRESHRIDQQIWDALAIKSGESVLWCGLPVDRAWVQRIVEIGAKLTIIEGDSDRIRDAEADGFTVQRGSTTMIGARPGSYDVAVAFHYLHEIDPSFHAPVVAELARVGKRLAVVEPAPPADHLGRRIAQLYALAKREQGSFENYQPVDYWRKLLAIAKGDVVLETLTFRRVPPKHAVEETVRMILRAMAAEDLPENYLSELEALARRPDAQLLPLSRYVIVAANVGEMPSLGAGTKFRPNESLEDPPPPEPAPRAPARLPAAARTEYTPAQIAPEIPPFEPPATTRQPAAAAPGADLDDPFAEPPAAETASPAGPSLLPAVFRRKKRQPAAAPAEAPVGTTDEPPFGAPFAVPVDLDPFAEPSGPAGNLPRYGEVDTFGQPDAGAAPVDPFGAPSGAEGGWQWEPPEDSLADLDELPPAPAPERPR